MNRLNVDNEVKVGIQRLAQNLFEGITDTSDFEFFLHFVEQYTGIASDVLEQSINSTAFYDELVWDTETSKWMW